MQRVPLHDLHDLGRRHLRPGGRCRMWPSSVFGHRSIVLENRWMRVTVLIDRGGLLHEVLWKPTDHDVLWRWDRGLRPTGGIPPSTALPQGGYQDAFVGGWDLMFPAVSRLEPADSLPVGSHGEVWALPWEPTLLQDSPDSLCLSLTTQCLRTPFALTRTFSLGEDAVLACETEVVNRGRAGASYAFGEHAVWNISDLLDHGGSLVVPGGEVQAAPHQPHGSAVAPGSSGGWPEVPLAGGGTLDVSKLGRDVRGTTAVTAVTMTDGRLQLRGGGPGRPSVELTWDVAAMPHLLLWHSYGGDLGAPWFGTTELLGAEPVSALPWSDPLQLPILPAGGRLNTWWRMHLAPSAHGPAGTR